MMCLLRYKLTPEGYKSFYGGWIEGLSEDQHVYYYNTITGESSWHLPDELGGVQEENSQEIAAEDSEYITRELAPHHEQHEPTHHFLDVYVAPTDQSGQIALEPYDFPVQGDNQQYFGESGYGEYSEYPYNYEQEGEGNQQAPNDSYDG